MNYDRELMFQLLFLPMNLKKTENHVLADENAHFEEIPDHDIGYYVKIMDPGLPDPSPREKWCGTEFSQFAT
jgi:hypothetical protein